KIISLVNEMQQDTEEKEEKNKHLKQSAFDQGTMGTPTNTDYDSNVGDKATEEMHESTGKDKGVVSGKTSEKEDLKAASEKRKLEEQNKLRDKIHQDELRKEEKNKLEKKDKL